MEVFFHQLQSGSTRTKAPSPWPEHILQVEATLRKIYHQKDVFLCCTCFERNTCSREIRFFIDTSVVSPPVSWETIDLTVLSYEFP